MDKILWSQIFSGFYNVNFPLYNGLWYNSNSDTTDKYLVPNSYFPAYNSQIFKKVDKKWKVEGEMKELEENS